MDSNTLHVTLSITILLIVCLLILVMSSYLYCKQRTKSSHICFLFLNDVFANMWPIVSGLRFLSIALLIAGFSSKALIEDRKAKSTTNNNFTAENMTNINQTPNKDTIIHQTSDNNDTMNIDKNDTMKTDTHNTTSFDKNDTMKIDTHNTTRFDKNDAMKIDTHKMTSFDKNDTMIIDANDTMIIGKNDTMIIDTSDTIHVGSFNGTHARNASTAQRFVAGVYLPSLLQHTTGRPRTKEENYKMLVRRASIITTFFFIPLLVLMYVLCRQLPRVYRMFF